MSKRVGSAGSSGPTSPATVTPAGAYSTHASGANAGGAAVAAALASGSNPTGAKARRLAKEAEERAAREAKEEEMNVHSYNEMLKKLLSKEIAAREAQEARVAEVAADLERFKTQELEALHAAQKAALAVQAEQLQMRARTLADAEVEDRVKERVTALRAADSQRYSSMADIQRKLRVEFEDSYAQRLAKEQRDKRELSEKLASAQARNEALSTEVKALNQAIDHRDGLVRALEHRVASLEKLKFHLRSYRNLVRFMTARVFINTVRLKRQLHAVHDSLSALAEKLAENAEYDRSSEIILPQHELEQWLARASKLVSKPKVYTTALGGLAAAFGPGGGKDVVVVSPNDVAGAVLALSEKSSSGRGKGTKADSMKKKTVTMQGESATTRESATPSNTGSASATGAATAASTADAVVSPAPSPSPTPRSAAVRRTPRSAASHTRTFPSSSLDGGSGSGGGVSGNFFDDYSDSFMPKKGAYTNPLRFNAMLVSLGEVEFILRGCLIECLSKAAEWKGSCEDFFLRNQELVGENIQLKDNQKKLMGDIQQLQGAVAILQRGMTAGGAATTAEERKALLSLTEGGLDGSFSSGSNTPFLAGSSGGVSGGEVKGVAQALSLLEAHAHSQRLAHVNPASPRDLARLSAQDLAELSRQPAKAQGGATAPTASSSDGKSGAPRGFFDHHNALVQCCMGQKVELERVRRSNASYKAQLEALREALRQAKVSAQYGVPLPAPSTTNHHSTSGGEEEKEAPVSSFGSASPPEPQSAEDGTPTQPLPQRPLQLDVDDNHASRSIRPLIPFSPPVGPVSPWMTGSAAVAGTPGSSRPDSSHGLPRGTSPYTGRIMPNSARGIHSSSNSTAPSTPHTFRSQSRGSQNSAVPHSARKAASGTPSTPVITTSSSSYASTPVYTPHLHLFAPGAYAHAHGASRSAERVYGHGGLSDVVGLNSTNGTPTGPPRPRGGSGNGVAARIAAAATAQAAARGTLNPLIASGLLPGSSTSVAAAVLHAKGLALHPSLEITGDIRYDIISPYVAQPLPWERAAGFGSRPVTAGSAALQQLPSPAVNIAATAASGVERRRKAAQYGKQVQQQHAAAIVAREREEKAYQYADFERPFQQLPAGTEKRNSQRFDADLPLRASIGSASAVAGPRSTANASMLTSPAAAPLSTSSSRPISASSTSALSPRVPRPSAPQQQFSFDSPPSHPAQPTGVSPPSDYRSVRTGGALGQRPHAPAPPASSIPHHVVDEYDRESYDASPFDRSPSRSQQIVSRVGGPSAPPNSTLGTAPLSQSKDLDDEDDYQDDYEQMEEIRDEDMQQN